jgi:hypothetical protein
MDQEEEIPQQTPAMEVIRLENGALVKSLHGGPYPREPWQTWYSIGGSKGCIESNRWPDPNEVTVYLDKDREIRRYTARHDRLQQEAASTQHWGADLFLVEAFARAVLEGSKPDIDVYMGLDMTLVGSLGWRSVLQGGGWIDIPDLRNEAVRREWEDDHYSCRPGTPEPYLLPNHATLGRTLLPGAEALQGIRQRQESEPYHEAMYKDWGPPDHPLAGP